MNMNQLYDLLESSTLYSGSAKMFSYAKSNPAEAAKVEAYWRNGGTRPTVATKFGEFLIATADDLRPVTPPTPGTNPSGVPMPVGNLAGWTQIFADDFNTNVPLGQFPAAVSQSWGGYPYPWTGTPTWGVYDSARTTSFHDGMQDIWIRTVNGEHLIAANYPCINGQHIYQTYGRWSIRYKTDSFPNYKASWLLWPVSETWPRDGEIDFPEAAFNGAETCAFMHRQGGTSGGDQDAYCEPVPMAGAWHTATIEWLPNRCTFLLDGNVIGQPTSRIPNTPMRYVIQNGGIDTEAPDSVQGHILIDWLVIYKPA